MKNYRTQNTYDEMQDITENKRQKTCLDSTSFESIENVPSSLLGRAPELKLKTSNG